MKSQSWSLYCDMSTIATQNEIICWFKLSPFFDSTVKPLWLLICDKSRDELIMTSLGISITKQDYGNFNVTMSHHKANGHCDFTLSFTMELRYQISLKRNKRHHILINICDCNARYVTSTIWVIRYLLNLSLMAAFFNTYN